MGLVPEFIDLDTDRTALTDRLKGISTAFLAIAGRGAEDGTLQGFLETLGIDYTGSGVLASAVAMHKLRAKTVVKAVGVATPNATEVDTTSEAAGEAARIMELLGENLIVKPVNEGCSVGLRRVRGLGELTTLLDAADTALMAEAYHHGRSVSVGILEDRTIGLVTTLPPLEVETADGIYTQSAKNNSRECVYRCPAVLKPTVEETLRRQALVAHRALGCHSYSRHDFIVTNAGQVLWLEANTLPGLSHQGNLARMACAAGLSYEQLISHILRGARTDRRASA
jgi:D-alanine-D-alanine ligase